MGVLDDVEAPDALLLAAGRVVAVQGQVHHHALLLLLTAVLAVPVVVVVGGHGHGRPRVARQAVGVRLAVRAVQHHGLGVGQAAGAR